MNNNKKRINKIIDVILNIFIVFFVIILFFSLYIGFQIKVLKNDYANFFGYSLFETQTGSMKDTINPGDWIVVKLTKDVKIGDIVTYKINDDFVTHRIVEAYKGTYITKGDNNKSKDAPVDESQIVGKVKKVLNNFGIIRKTLFNKKIILLLIIVLFLFNIFMKDDKDNAKYEAKIKLFIRRGIAKLKELLNNKKEPKEIVKDEIKEIKPTKKEVKPDKEIKPVIKEEVKPVVEEPKEEETEEKIEEELSKTSMFRIISVDDTKKTKQEEKDKEEIKEEKIEEELSKTSLLSIVEVDTSDVNSKVPKNTKKEHKPKKEEKPGVVGKEIKTVKTDTGNNYINYNNLKEDVSDKTQEFLDGLDVSKAKNLIEKAIKVKECELYQILDILNLDNYEYVKNSSLKDDFIEEYIKVYYYNTQSKGIKKVHDHFLKVEEALTKKYIRNDVTLRTIKIFTKEMDVIAELENKRHLNSDENRVYDKVLEKNFKWPHDYVEFVTNSIMSIQNKTHKMIEDTLKKLETDVFKMEEKKVGFRQNALYVYLDHNIEFNKVYSEYIVDKTYNEGLIAEDKTAVLLSLLSIELATDLLGLKNINYVVNLPDTLYTKEKKMESLFKVIDDEYSYNHVNLLISAKELIKHKRITKKLKKKGYTFTAILDCDKSAIMENLEQLYLADTYLLDKKDPNSKTYLKSLPKEIKDKVEFENISKLLEK